MNRFKKELIKRGFELTVKYSDGIYPSYPELEAIVVDAEHATLIKYYDTIVLYYVFNNQMQYTQQYD